MIGDIVMRRHVNNVFSRYFFLFISDRKLSAQSSSASARSGAWASFSRSYRDVAILRSTFIISALGFFSHMWQIYCISNALFNKKTHCDWMFLISVQGSPVQKYLRCGRVKNVFCSASMAQPTSLVVVVLFKCHHYICQVFFYMSWILLSRQSV